MNNYILAGAQRQAELEAAKAAFVASGGQVQELAAREAPIRFRSERVDPETVLSRKRSSKPVAPEQPDMAAEAKRKAKEAQILMVREMATIMTLAQAQKETGLSTYALRNMARHNGFRFLNPSNTANPIDDAVNVVRIKEARDRGLTRTAARVELGMSSSQMHRLIERYGIDYPVHPAFDRSRKDAAF